MAYSKLVGDFKAVPIDEEGYPDKRTSLDQIEVTMGNGEKKYLPSGEDPEPDEDFFQIVTIAGHPFMYAAITQDQNNLMDAIAGVAGKIGNINYLIDYIKRIPV